MTYGSESRRVPLSTTVPDVGVDVERNNSMFNFHILFQVSPFDGFIKPYFEGVAGGAYLYTETDVSGDDDFYDFASSTNQDDFAWSYGVGGGFLILLSEGTMEIPGGLSLDLKARYMFGSQAEYLTEGDIDILNGRVILNTRNSETDFLSVHLGVVAGL